MENFPIQKFEKALHQKVETGCRNEPKAKLPHPVSTCVFRIALRFQSNNFFFHRHQQAKVCNKKTQCNAVNPCVNGMCKRALNLGFSFIIVKLKPRYVEYNKGVHYFVFQNPNK